MQVNLINPINVIESVKKQADLQSQIKQEKPQKPQDFNANSLSYKKLGLDFGALSTNKEQDEINAKSYEILKKYPDVLKDALNWRKNGVSSSFLRVSEEILRIAANDFMEHIDLYSDMFWAANGIDAIIKFEKETNTDLSRVKRKLMEKGMDGILKEINDIDRKPMPNISGNWIRDNFKMITSQEANERNEKLMKNEFKNIYLFSDDFAKTKEFEELLKQYVEVRSNRFYVLDENEKLRDFIMANGFTKKDWLEFFQSNIDDLKFAMNDKTRPYFKFYYADKLDYFERLKNDFSQNLRAVDLRV